MRLGFYTPNYPGITQDGGIGTYTRDLARTLTKLGHVVHVVTPGTGDDSTDGAVQVHQVNLCHVPIIDRFYPGFGNCYHLSRRLKQLVDQHQLELIELPNWEGLGIFYQKSRKTPTVVRLHTSSKETQIIDQLPMTRLLEWDVKREHQQAQQADLLITHSEAHRQMMCEELGISADRIELIPHGVEVFPDFVRPPRSPGPLRVVFLGRLEKRKGTLELLQAFPKVLELHPGTELTLIGTDRPHCPGDRTHAQWIQDELPEAVRQQIRLAGRLPQEQVNQLLQTADVFIAPSRYESFGLIYPEAMRWGIPVIGCNVGGVSEIIQNEKSGMLIPPESPDAIVQALHRLLRDESLRQQLGTAGRKRVESDFSSMKMTERVVAKFEKLLASKGRRN